MQAGLTKIYRQKIFGTCVFGPIKCGGPVRPNMLEHSLTRPWQEHVLRTAGHRQQVLNEDH